MGKEGLQHLNESSSVNGMDAELGCISIDADFTSVLINRQSAAGFGVVCLRIHREFTNPDLAASPLVCRLVINTHFVGRLAARSNPKGSIAVHESTARSNATMVVHWEIPLSEGILHKRGIIISVGDWHWSWDGTLFLVDRSYIVRPLKHFSRSIMFQSSHAIEIEISYSYHNED
jgi:hypothetical protein